MQSAIALAKHFNKSCESCAMKNMLKDGSDSSAIAYVGIEHGAKAASVSVSTTILSVLPLMHLNQQ